MTESTKIAQFEELVLDINKERYTVHVHVVAYFKYKSYNSYQLTSYFNGNFLREV